MTYEMVNELNKYRTSSEVIKLFSYSTQLRLKFKMLTNAEKAQINGTFRFKSPKTIIYNANKC